jgi:peptidyl-dipeptidase A
MMVHSDNGDRSSEFETSAAAIQPRADGPIEHGLLVGTVAALLLSIAGCSGKPAATADAPGAQKQESADDFVARINLENDQFDREQAAADWTQKTFITVDTEYLNARATDRQLAFISKSAAESKQYDGQPLSPATARSIKLLRLAVSAPAPSDPAKRAELTQIMARLEAMYGEGKYCPKGPESCKNLDQLSQVLAKSRNYDELVDAWKGWHDVAAQMRDPYRKFVDLANEGARELGFKDLGVMWRAKYDMSPEEFDATAEKLWQQEKPL